MRRGDLIILFRRVGLVRGFTLARSFSSVSVYACTCVYAYVCIRVSVNGTVFNIIVATYLITLSPYV